MINPAFRSCDGHNNFDGNFRRRIEDGKEVEKKILKDIRELNRERWLLYKERHLKGIC